MDFEFASADDKCKSQVEMPVGNFRQDTGRIPELAAKLYRNLLRLTFGLQKYFCCKSPF